MLQNACRHLTVFVAVAFECHGTNLNSFLALMNADGGFPKPARAHLSGGTFNPHTFPGAPAHGNRRLLGGVY